MTAVDRIIAIVYDDEVVRRALKRHARSLCNRTADFGSGEAFLESLSEAAPACVLLDLHMPGPSGLEVLQALRSRRVKLPTIVITGSAQTGMRERCMKAGAAAYLQKPLDRDVFLVTIQTATAD
jgi:FixJ family two-component response regulator